jgi:hypothetical protein
MDRNRQAAGPTFTAIFVLKARNRNGLHNPG